MDIVKIHGYHFVRKDRPGATSISTLERLEMALQAAKGLKILHDNNFVHRYVFRVFFFFLVANYVVLCVDFYVFLTK